ncbi:unnamed protein product [Eruca vesicaria subsp. sativa]|uniref:Uncharacterized protein n=1 Tax=Eruca vesicaria subsp. sativa TaxID=29727 RepID=A0ABC8KX01_ERUVS|nr:unnamed protein product [Eruca vesicaria subsp. sativa]
MAPKPNLAPDFSSIDGRVRIFLVRSSFVVGGEKVVVWREKYSLSEDVAIRIPGPIDRVSYFEIDKIPVYKGFFESSFRNRVPSLVAKDLVIGVAEVLCHYSVSPLNSGEGRYYLHPCSKIPLVQEIPIEERKRDPVFEGCWNEKFVFMHLPGFYPVWQAAGGS